MSAYVIVGMQWGDEGKGKIVDYLTPQVDVVIRHQGGNNAGHTVVVGDKRIILHLIPSGALHGKAMCVIGNGTVLDPAVLVEELDGLAAAGYSVEGRLFISGSAHVIMPYHKLLDKAQEQFRGSGRIGTTGRGIGPAYADKADRFGLRMSDLIDPEVFRRKLQPVLEYKNAILRGAFGESPLDHDSVYAEYLRYAQRLRPFVADAVQLVHRALAAGKRLLFEGAQGSMLDIDHGTFPYVTSSTTVAGGVCGGAGLAPKDVSGVIGIVKAYTTRVGEGPFPTELRSELGDHLRDKGREFGATTGRPRRCGWLDMVQLRRVAALNGVSNVILTKPDVLGGLEVIRLCMSYRVDGATVNEFPADTCVLERVEPVYEEMAGWAEDISWCRKWADLPENARRYFGRIQDLLGVPISLISVGASREQTIERSDPLC